MTDLKCDWIDLPDGQRLVVSPSAKWYYTSFADDTGFLGGCFLPAPDETHVITVARAIGCNPGGEARIWQLPDKPSHVPVGKLLTREELDTLGPPDET